MKKDKLTNEEPVAEVAADGTENKPKNKARRAVIIGICVMAVLGAVSWLLLYGKPEILDNAADKVQDKIAGMYGSNQSYIYYPVDDALDVTLVDEYMELDRTIHYTLGAETFALTDDIISIFGKDVQFFKAYFECAVAGDYQTYNSLFTDNYYKKNEPYYSFAPQMIYDIYIEKLSEDTSSGNTVYAYNVSYKIFRNNGTFRNDIGSDGSKTLYFELVEQDGIILIDKIDYYV